MIRWLLAISRLLAFFTRPYFFWKEKRNSAISGAEDEDRALPVFEDESQITHARLSHFADQIGRWHISLSTKEQNTREEERC
jgi:hypothetical protein